MHIKRSRGMVRQQGQATGTGRIYERQSLIFERAVRYAEQCARDLAQHGEVRIIRQNFENIVPHSEAGGTV